MDDKYDTFKMKAREFMKNLDKIKTFGVVNDVLVLRPNKVERETLGLLYNIPGLTWGNCIAVTYNYRNSNGEIQVWSAPTRSKTCRWYAILDESNISKVEDLAITLGDGLFLTFA